MSRSDSAALAIGLSPRAKALCRHCPDCGAGGWLNPGTEHDSECAEPDAIAERAAQSKTPALRFFDISAEVRQSGGEWIFGHVLVVEALHTADACITALNLLDRYGIDARGLVVTERTP